VLRIRAAFLACLALLSLPSSAGEVDHWTARVNMMASHAAVLGSGRTLFLGDSLTEGLWWNYACGPAVNAGMGGIRISALLSHINAIMAATRPAVVVILVGINDATRMAPGQPADPATVGAFSGRYSQLLDAITTHGAKPALLTILPVERVGPLGDAYFDSNAIRQFNSAIRAFAANRGLPLVDAHSNFVGADGFMHAGWSIDGVHLYGAPGGSPNHILYNHFLDGDRQARAQMGQSCAA
jgi:hypothetical protein